MAETDAVTPLRREPLPEYVNVDPATMATTTRLAPNELRALKAQTGKGMNELLGEGADDADRLQTLVWLRVRRDLGRADVTWAECGDVAVGFEATPADPTSAPGETSSLPSAGTGA
jgi:hypothetical protein